MSIAVGSVALLELVEKAVMSAARMREKNKNGDIPISTQLLEAGGKFRFMKRRNRVSNWQRSTKQEFSRAFQRIPNPFTHTIF